MLYLVHVQTRVFSIEFQYNTMKHIYSRNMILENACNECN